MSKFTPLGIFNSWEKRSQMPEELYGPSLPHIVTKPSGGHSSEIADVNRLPDVASKIGAALRAQYGLGYSEGNARRKVSPRKSEACSAQGFRKLQASWRHGY